MGKGLMMSFGLVLLFVFQGTCKRIKEVVTRNVKVEEYSLFIRKWLSNLFILKYLIMI